MGGTICKSRAEGQVSQSTLWLPWFVVNRLLEGVRIAEERVGGPVTVAEIYAVMIQLYGRTKETEHGMMLVAVLNNLLREDMIFIDKLSYRYTLTKQEGYFSYSDIFQMKYPHGGYAVNSNGLVVISTARTLNLQNLKAVLQSKDEALFESSQWMFDGDFRFLDGENIEHDRTGFTSFPRSGNSFLRRYVEQITGVTTGSTMSLLTATSLQIMGLKGEANVSDDVWVCKSHHPFGSPIFLTHTPKKTFMTVRHPLDVIPSWAAFLNTFSHGNKPDFDIVKEYPEWWDNFVRTWAVKMRQFFETLLRHHHETYGHPLYIVRYEDLVREPKETLMGLMSFILRKSDLQGTNLERRIDQVLSKGKAATTTYQLKQTTGQFDVHAEKYTPELKQFVRDTLGDQLYYFGYANVEGNPTGFFDFDEHTEENLAKFNQFKADSKVALQTVSSATYTPKKPFTVNVGEGVFEMASHEEIRQYEQPAMSHARKTLNITEE